ncbi:hypothetical protein BD410DRAFT_626406 [Rickenella mellea]|uniref:Ndc10 domain-containing protein n=1 Tax=Rickenella mellea TaxID=50990 RepID=A0A4Y7QBU0_9AGAM|nr:hypothetical protein BD410DRAFT_626406 [Rickenella mellea]
MRPIAPTTELHHEQAKHYWIEYFTRNYKSKELAEKSLERGAKLPSTALIKQFVKNMAIGGKSCFDGKSGWSMSTTKQFASHMWGMLARAGVELPTADAKQQILHAIANWQAKVEKILPTNKQRKAIVREQDFADFIAMTFHPTLNIANNVSRIQLHAFSGVLFIKGQRPGSIVEAACYEGSNECVRWGDLEFYAVGWDEDAGLAVCTFWMFHFMKGMRMVDGEYTCSTTRSLPRNRAVLDPQLTILALGMYRGVFKEDVLQPLAEPNPHAAYPLRIHVKDEFLPKPVWIGVNNKEKAATVGDMTKLCQKVASRLGWRNFRMRSFRYAAMCATC